MVAIAGPSTAARTSALYAPTVINQHVYLTPDQLHAVDGLFVRLLDKAGVVIINHRVGINPEVFPANFVASSDPAVRMGSSFAGTMVELSSGHHRSFLSVMGVLSLQDLPS